MQPNSQEVGLILEPTDMSVFNDMRTTFKVKYDGEVTDSIKASIYDEIRLDEAGNMVLDQAISSRLLKDANVVLHDVKGKYRELDRKQDYLMGELRFDTPEYRVGEAELPILAQKIRTFGAFVVSAEENLDLSRNTAPAKASVHSSH